MSVLHRMASLRYVVALLALCAAWASSDARFRNEACTCPTTTASAAVPADVQVRSALCACLHACTELLLITLHPACYVQAAQRSDLVSLFSAWHGVNWHDASGWNTVQHHCSWAGISCCSNTTNSSEGAVWADSLEWELVELSFCCCNTYGAVTALQLPSNNVVGSIAALFNLSSLAQTLLYVILEDNQLAGSISTSINDFTRLRWLDASYNRVTGSLPELRNLTQLRRLALANNSLSGTLPATVTAGLPQLEAVILDHNLLEGSVNLQLLLLQQLQQFSVSNNRLSGKLVVPELSVLETVLDVDTGHWHVELNDLDLGHNYISGTIPPELFLLDLRLVDLSHNSLTGTLSPISSDTLQALRLAANSLAGALPQQLGGFGVSELDLSSNK